jgi:hypothetical protein
MATSRRVATFDRFLARCWNDHVGRADAVARRLRTRTPAPQEPRQLSALVRFVVHLLGEHLGRFDDARWRLDALRVHPLASDRAVESSLRVGIATLDLFEGHPDALARMQGREAAQVEAGTASMCLARGQLARALALIDSAAARLAALPDAAPADHRPLAAVCNNMAWELHGLGDRRTADETAAMLHVAAASREHWSRAGTWLEIERADYCLSRTHLAASLHDEAWRHAAQCLAVCLRHQAPPYERFYAHEAMARVHHARREAAELAHHAQAMREAHAAMRADEQAACRPELDAVLALQ